MMRIRKAYTPEEEFARMLREAREIGMERSWAVNNWEAKYKRSAPTGKQNAP